MLDLHKREPCSREIDELISTGIKPCDRSVKASIAHCKDGLRDGILQGAFFYTGAYVCEGENAAGRYYSRKLSTVVDSLYVFA